MLHFPAGALGFEVRGFQLEIPLRGTVGVVDQHQVWIVLQSFRLHFHRAAVLFDKLCEDEFQQRRPEWHPIENVPAGNDINAAAVTSDWRDRSQGQEPILPGSNRFVPQVR